MHRTSHWLGLDVRRRSLPERDTWRPLEPGMVLTVEPGLYFGEDRTEVSKPYRGYRHSNRGRRLVTPGIPSTTAATPRQWRDRIHLAQTTAVLDMAAPGRSNRGKDGFRSEPGSWWFPGDGDRGRRQLWRAEDRGQTESGNRRWRRRPAPIGPVAACKLGCWRPR
jgi:hypothetical protein